MGRKRQKRKHAQPSKPAKKVLPARVPPPKAQRVPRVSQSPWTALGVLAAGVTLVLVVWLATRDASLPASSVVDAAAVTTADAGARAEVKPAAARTSSAAREDAETFVLPDVETSGPPVSELLELVAFEGERTDAGLGVRWTAHVRNLGTRTVRALDASVVIVWKDNHAGYPTVAVHLAGPIPPGSEAPLVGEPELMASDTELRLPSFRWGTDKARLAVEHIEFAP